MKTPPTKAAEASILVAAKSAPALGADFKKELGFPADAAQL